MEKHTSRNNVPAIGEIQRESIGRTALSGYRKLGRQAVCLFSDLLVALPNLHRLDTMTLEGGYYSKRLIVFF
jgi:hypothetical protein